MMTAANVSAGQAGSYYEADDYYSEGNTMPAQFGGKLAERLGLEAGGFDLRQFQAGLRGQFDTAQLKQAHTGKRAGLDCTFSAPKSVSIMALVAGDTRIAEAHQKAVAAAMERLEGLAAVRVTEDGKTESVPVDGVAYASFLHTTSRAGDCQLHTHNVIFNAVMGPDGQLRALDNREIFKAQKEADAVYKAELAAELVDIGYELRMTKDGYELASVDQALIDEFSQRKQAIDAELAANGLDREDASAAARQAATMATRDTKKTYDRETLIAWWNERAAAYGLPLIPQHEQHLSELTTQEQHHDHYHHTAQPHPDQAGLKSANGLRSLSERHLAHNGGESAGILQIDVLANRQANDGVRRAAGGAGRLTPEQIDEALALAVAHYAERQAVIKNPHDLIARTMHATEYRAKIGDIEAALSRAIESKVLLKGDNGRALVIGAALETEQALDAHYDRAQGACAPIATAEDAAAQIAAFEKLAGFKLSAGQSTMVENITTGNDRIFVVEGDAGTGKSTGMEAVKKISEANGYKVFGLAPSAQAVESLRASNIDTITSQRANIDEKFWEKIDSKTIVILDESGLVDSRSMKNILDRIESKGARIALVGDSKQYGSVEAGAAHSQFVEKAKEVNKLSRLEEMQRWKNEIMKEFHYLSRDDQGTLIKRLFETGNATALQTKSRRFDVIADRYAKIPQSEKSEFLAMTGKNSDRNEINKAIRKKIGIEGQGIKVETFERKNFTEAERKLTSSYDIGDVIRFEVKTDSYKKGEMIRVVDKTKESLIVESSNGIRSEFFPVKDSIKAMSVGNNETIDIVEGERIRFTAGDKDRKIDNGDLGTVLKIDGDKATIKIDGGKTVQLPLDKTLMLRHGYAQTGPSAQGAGKKHALGHVTSDDPTVNKNAIYTIVTRGKNNFWLCTDAKEGHKFNKLIKAVTREYSKDLARDVVLDAPQRSAPVAAADQNLKPAGQEKPAAPIAAKSTAAEPARTAPVAEDQKRLDGKTHKTETPAAKAALDKLTESMRKDVAKQKKPEQKSKPEKERSRDEDYGR